MTSPLCVPETFAVGQIGTDREHVARKCGYRKQRRNRLFIGLNYHTDMYNVRVCFNYGLYKSSNFF